MNLCFIKLKHLDWGGGCFSPWKQKKMSHYQSCYALVSSGSSSPSRWWPHWPCMEVISAMLPHSWRGLWLIQASVSWLTQASISRLYQPNSYINYGWFNYAVPHGCLLVVILANHCTAPKLASLNLALVSAWCLISWKYHMKKNYHL